ncbi:MAG: methyltransferase domain-containing protein [Vicinamibacterales bacterium]
MRRRRDNVYERWVFPWLMAAAARPLARARRAVVPQAVGEVVEIGCGRGDSLPHYRWANVTRVTAIDPNPGMVAAARRAAVRSGHPIDVIVGDAARMPIAAASVDTVVSTLTLCSIPDVDAALGEVRRVLRDGGRLLFFEHGEAPDARVRAWQRRIEPVHRVLFCGCRVTRPVSALIERAGFRLDEITAEYWPGAPRYVGYCSWGTASVPGRPRQARSIGSEAPSSEGAVERT